MIGNILHDVLVMNNTCVQQLQNDNLSEGMLALQHAVSTVRNASTMVVPFKPNLAFQATLQGHPMSMSYRFCLTPRNWAPTSITEQLNLPDHSTVGMFYVYDCPLLLHVARGMTAQVASNDSYQDDAVHMQLMDNVSYNFTIISGTLLFNLALLYHRVGRLFGQESALVKAAKLYSVLIELLNGVYSSPISSLDVAQMDVPTILLALTLNNLSHIQNELCNYGGCHACMTTLYELVLNPRYDCHLSRFSHLSSLISENEHDISDEIRMNIMFWKTLPPRTSAQAA